MADAADLKSAEGFLLYGFESRLRHHCFADGWHETFCPLGTLHACQGVEKKSPGFGASKLMFSPVTGWRMSSFHACSI